MQISTDEDTLDDLILKRLADDYENLKNEFLNTNGIRMYSMDKELDRELVFSLIQAIRKVHNYYAYPKDRITY